MGAFLGISLWIALATVVPGLITIATLYGAFVFINLQLFKNNLSLMQANDWVWAGGAITIMVLTQAVGILLEEFLVNKKKLGNKTKTTTIPKGIDPFGKTEVTINPYDEYNGLYILLAELKENEDTQGHLKRAIAQFFLTNNSLVSFSVGIVAALLITLISVISNISYGVIIRGSLYVIALGACLIVSYKVAVIRFMVMSKSLWATRRVRISNNSSVSASNKKS